MIMDSMELTLIDSGITSLRNDVTLLPSLTMINLHCNFISTIENLQAVPNLVHLDLSSNQIKIIKGLDCLINLKTLNLSSNQIRKVQGFSRLHNLNKVNISYNCIEDLSGFSSMAGANYKLERVDLQGNRINSQKSVVDSFRNCVNLRVLNLRSEGADNPVCSSRNYRQNISGALSHVLVLDNFDKAGNLAPTSIDIPGLDDYLSQILPSSSSSDSVVAISTPNIDAVIDNFKQRKTPVETSEKPSEIDSSDIRKMVQKEELDRLHRIEEQLARLLESREAKTTKYNLAKKDTDVTDESDTTEGNKRSSSSQSDSRRKVPAAKLSKTPPNRRSLGVRKATAKAEDEKMKVELQSTYQHLVDDLNGERERRFKAEHACKQLADRVKQLQLETRLIDEKQGIATEVGGKLKEALTIEKDKGKELREENERLKEQLEDTIKRLEESKEAHNNTLVAMNSMEESVAKMNSDKMSANAHFTKLVNDAESRYAAASREVDLLKVQLKENSLNVQQLQQLMAIREQDHVKELEKRFVLGSPEIRDLLREESSKVEALYQNKLSNLQSKLDTSNTKYCELEDEFRDALYIEANRYNKLKDAFEKICDETEQNRTELTSLKNKDEKGTQLIQELSQLVKEQKGRIAELAKSKQEQAHDQRDRIQSLEAHLDEARRRLVQFELLKKDNQRLQAQYDGQQSIIEGLRAERKLWSQELAHQGSSLAQDRGRLEAKIESLNNEVNYLKKQLEKEVDSLKIKTKLIEDQTDSIRNLKEALLNRDEQVKTVRQEMLDIQKKLESEVCDEKQAYQDAQEMIQDLTDRKEELKGRVRELENDIDMEREDHKQATDQWKEKLDMIGKLESQVFDMKSSWEKKEKELVNEKDKAMRAANLAIDKMKQMDSAFKKQYETTKKNHAAELEKVVFERQKEVEECRERVDEVEGEMRVLLKEHVEARKLAEERVKKMGQAFTELQQQLL